MKRIALLVLALAANVIADEEVFIQQAATFFETDVQTVKECSSKANITVEQIQFIKQKWQEIKDDEDIDEETKESLTAHGHFIECILEKKNLMQDSKLLLDNILKAFEKDQNNSEGKQVLMECVNLLNEDDKITGDQRAFGLIVCIARILEQSNT